MLCWSRQRQQVCHFSSLFGGLLFLLSDSHSVLATLLYPPSFLLPQTLWQIWQELSSLSSCFIRLQWVPGHSFLSGNDATDELVRRGALLLLSTSLVVSLLSFASALLFSRTGGVLSHRNSWTHRFPSLDFHRGTCAPSWSTLCSLLSTLQRIQPSVKFLSL